MKTLSLVFALFLAAPLAIAKNEPPASIVISAPVDAVKSAIVARLTSRGYRLESDSQFQMVWSKEMDGGKGMIAQMIAGNANCAMPKHILSLTFAITTETDASASAAGSGSDQDVPAAFGMGETAKTKPATHDAIAVTGTQQVDVAGALCVRQRTELNGKNNQAEMAGFLADIKAKSETVKVPSKN
jgi:hypothetical protein